MFNIGPMLRFAAMVGALSVATSASACDMCGCAGGGGTLGLLQLMPRHFAGFRWQTQGYSTDAHGAEVDSKETFHTVDLWGQWRPHRRLRLIADIPFIVNQRRFADGVRQQVEGIGDVYMLSQFSLLDPDRQSMRAWSHTLQAGGGVKLPTGAFRHTDAEGELLTPAMQAGSGSTDWMLSAFYALRKGAWGASADVLARFNTANPEGFDAGDKLNASVRAFWSKKTGKNMFLPWIGLTYDHRRSDFERGEKVLDTGGWAILSAVGVEWIAGNWMVGANLQIPTAYHFSGGRISPETRAQVALTRFFGGGAKTKLATPKPFENVR